jgi:cytochrome c-type biogenesis protein CcmH
MAMMPAMKLSSFPQVRVVARISKSGNAMPQSDDLQGMSSVISNSTRDIKIVIDHVMP